MYSGLFFTELYKIHKNKDFAIFNIAKSFFITYNNYCDLVSYSCHEIDGSPFKDYTVYNQYIQLRGRYENYSFEQGKNSNL